MKAWKKGVILGLVWGILSIPMELLFAYLWGWERAVPKILKAILQVAFHLPSKSVLLIAPFPPNLIKIWLINLVGWALVGVILGYAYGKLRRGAE